MTTVPSAHSTSADSKEVSISSTLPQAEDWREPIVRPHPSPVLERLFRRRTGLAPAVVPYVAPHAWAYRPFLFLMNPDLEALDASLCSQICFVVARDNACRFCYGSFRAFLRVAGYSEAELDHLEGEFHLNEVDSAERRALEFAVQVSQGRLQQDPSVAPLERAGYGPTAIREIVGVAVTATLINRVATMLAIPLNEDAESFTSQWYFDVMQPVLRTLLRGWQRYATSRAPPLDADAVEGPLAPWVRRLRGTCVGHVIHNCARSWLRHDGALPLRPRLLVLAVVARGLHAPALEDRAAALLAERCGVSDAAYDAAVDHLRGDAVGDRTENLLLLARESIRYEAGRIQPTVREHVANLSRAETIDAVATLGLTNALARLRALASLDN